MKVEVVVPDKFKGRWGRRFGERHQGGGRAQQQQVAVQVTRPKSLGIRRTSVYMWRKELELRNGGIK